eukprot:1194608-Prorocentrum_minimum.AAC.7
MGTITHPGMLMETYGTDGAMCDAMDNYADVLKGRLIQQEQKLRARRRMTEDHSTETTGEDLQACGYGYQLEEYTKLAPDNLWLPSSMPQKRIWRVSNLGATTWRPGVNDVTFYSDAACTQPIIPGMSCSTCPALTTELPRPTHDHSPIHILKFVSIPLRVDSPAKIDWIVSRVPPAKFSAEIETLKGDYEGSKNGFSDCVFIESTDLKSIGNTCILRGRLLQRAWLFRRSTYSKMGCLCPGRIVCSGSDTTKSNAACSSAFDGAADTKWRPDCNDCTAGQAWIGMELHPDVVVGCATVAGNLGQAKQWNGGLALEVSTNGERTWDRVGAKADSNTVTVDSEQRWIVSSCSECALACDVYPGCYMYQCDMQGEELGCVLGSTFLPQPAENSAILHCSKLPGTQNDPFAKYNFN